jgi:hypothetical protein
MKISHQGKILAASVLAAVGTLGYIVKTELEKPVRTPVTVMSVEEGQQSLDELVKDPRLEEFDEVVSAVVYDPQFSKYEQELQRHLREGRATNNVEMIQGAERKLQVLPMHRMKKSQATAHPEGGKSGVGKKSIIYVGEGFFYNTKEDQLSVLYHEQIHATSHRYGFRLPRSLAMAQPLGP